VTEAENDASNEMQRHEKLMCSIQGEIKGFFGIERLDMIFIAELEVTLHHAGSPSTRAASGTLVSPRLAAESDPRGTA
jgi:hypothetical protein